MNNKHILAFFWTALVYLLLFLRFSYTFGGNDQIEILPLASYLNDTTLFNKDFYVQIIAASWPNERFFIIQLIRLLPENLWNLWCFIGHLFFSFLLIIGLNKIASLFIKNKLFCWLAVIANLVFLYLVAPGGNELYYNQLIASLAAKAIATWAVYYYFRKDYFIAFNLLIPATLIHPLVGLHLFLVFSAVYVLMNFKFSLDFFPRFFKSVILFMLIAFSYVLFLKYNNDKFDSLSQLSESDYYKIIVDFRNPHHYSPVTFPIKNYLVTIFLMLMSILAFRKNKVVLIFILTAILFFISGIANELFIKNATIATFQVFKIAVWIKYFGVIGLFVLLEKFLPLDMLQKQIKYFGFITAFIIIGFVWGYYAEPKTHLNNLLSNTADNEADICIKAQQFSSKEALFIHPVQFTKFHFYSKRSSFVNFKVMARNKNYIETWIQRLSLIYEIDANMPEKGFDIQAKANANFSKIDFAKTQLLKEKGITHMITFKTHQIDNLQVLAENAQYKIYKL